MQNDKLKQLTGDITPLPWKVEQKHSFITNISSSTDDICQISDLYGRKKHASLTLPDKEYDEAKKWNEKIDIEKQQNAAYIVKACNLFPELVEALEVFAKMSNEIPEGKKGNVFGYNNAKLSIEDFRKAKELINKAKS